MSVTEVIAQIKAAINKAIPELTNVSGAAIWYKIVTVFGAVISSFQQECESTLSQTVASARGLKLMGVGYYEEVSKAFQVGYQVSIINSQTFMPGYATIDPAAQIITHAYTSTGSAGIITQRVAKTQNGRVVPLADSELTEFKNYFWNFFPLGITAQIISPIPNEIDSTALYIYYDKTSSLTTIQEEIQKTLNNFILITRAPLFVNQIEDTLKEISGIRSAYFSNITVMWNGNRTSPSNGILDVPSGFFNFSTNILTLDNKIGPAFIFKAI